MDDQLKEKISNLEISSAEFFAKERYVGYQDWEENPPINCFKIGFNDIEEKLTLAVCAECCDKNYFDGIDGVAERMIGKRLRDLAVSKRSYFDDGGVYTNEECYIAFHGRSITRTITMLFDDDSEVELLWKNLSNGYYAGYLDINFC